MRACVRAWLMRACVRGSCVRAWLMRACVAHACVAHACVRACVVHACVRACLAHACVRAWLMRACVRACVRGSCVLACVAHACVRGSCVRACVRAWLMRACVRVWLMRASVRGSCVRACVRDRIFVYDTITFPHYSTDCVTKHMASFKCSKCSYNTIRNYDLTRHLKSVHGIYANTSVKRYSQPQVEIPTRMSEERRYRGVSHRPQDMMEEQDYSEEEEEEEEEEEKEEEGEEEEEGEARTHPMDGLYAEQIDDMTRKKCRILDCVLDTFPEHLKTKAKSMCDTLKCKDRLFILPSHEIVIDGKIVRGSNIRDYIMDSLVEPPKPGTIKFTMLEKENEGLKQNLAYVEKALARARGVWRCRKFESIIDGTVDRCDFSDDTYSEESKDGEDDPDENEEDDGGEYDEEDDTDDEEEEEPSRKRQKKN